MPHAVEFWQAGPARMADRLCFTRPEVDDSGHSDGEWVLQRLAP